MLMLPVSAAEKTDTLLKSLPLLYIKEMKASKTKSQLPKSIRFMRVEQWDEQN